MRAYLSLLVSCLPAFAGEFPQPKPTKPDEPTAKAWSPAKAAEYLDGVGVNWTRDRQCVTCHTNMPYMMARPLLKGTPDEGWKEVRKFLEADVAKWNAGGKTKGDAYVVATATALAFSDAATTGKLHPSTRDALDRMWATQRKTGEWAWLKCEWPPMEHDDFYGALLAVVAVGVAPEKYAETEKAREGIDRLKVYFAKNRAPDLHHKTMLLWASARIHGLLPADDRTATIDELKKLQRDDGGWSLPSLGKYARRDKTANDPAAPSDGYATGLVVYVLRQSGVPTGDTGIRKGIEWLKGNQRESGRWYTRSLNNDKAHYITNAGTAFAVMALEACPSE